MAGRRRRHSPPHPLDGAGKAEQRPLAALQEATQEDHRASGAGDLAGTLDQFALLRGVEEFAAERHRHRRPVQHGPGDGEQAVIRERHEGAAMDVALAAVEMLLLDPEGAADLAVVLDPVPERAVMGLEIVPAPGSPAGEFALGLDMQVGALRKCGFGQVVHALRPWFENFSP